MKPKFKVGDRVVDTDLLCDEETGQPHLSSYFSGVVTELDHRNEWYVILTDDHKHEKDDYCAGFDDEAIIAEDCYLSPLYKAMDE